MSIRKWTSILSAILLTFAIGGCDVDQTEPGNLPEYDVETADVDVSTEEESMTVPDLDVSTEETDVTVPDLDVTMPE